jgi:LysM repeat protein
MKRYFVVSILALILMMALGSIANAGPELQGGGSIYYVTWGDTLTDIALRHGVSVEALMQQNGLYNPEMIYVGQPLIIPGQGYGGNYPNYGAAGCTNYHTVTVGESLSSIAWDYNTTLQALLRDNNLYNQDILFVGQTLCVPAGSSRGYTPQDASYRSGSVPANVYYHTVSNGETLSSIAYRYGVNQWNIVQANNLSNAAFIWAGQQLIIPSYQAQPQYYNTPGWGTGPADWGQHRNPPARPGYHGAYDDDRDDSYDDKPPYDDDDDGYDRRHGRKSDDDGANSVSDPPDYQPGPVSPLLPVAEHPIEAVVNGGENWVGTAYPSSGASDAITTLVVNTGEGLDLVNEEGPIIRIRSGETEAKGLFGQLPEYGIDKFRFAFKYITPGEYDVWIDDPELESEVEHVRIEPGQRVEIEFRKGLTSQQPTYASPDGWFLAGWENASVPHKILGGWSTILVRTPASGLWVILEAEGGFKAKCFTGSKGPGACEFGGLSAGIYYIHIDGTQFSIKTYMDGNAFGTFDLGHQ